MFAGKPLAEIAGYNVYQMRDVICRKRDKHGKLVRQSQSDLPQYVLDSIDDDGRRVVKGSGGSFKEMFYAVKRRQKVANINEAWAAHLLANPQLNPKKNKKAKKKRK